MESSEVYHISPIQLRNLEIEEDVHTRENAYEGWTRAHLTREQKEEKYDTLKESIRHKGFNEEFPIVIMIKRVNNKYDQIFQGHHRLNIAIELELPTVPVRFITTTTTTTAHEEQQYDHLKEGVDYLDDIQRNKNNNEKDKT